MSVAPLKRQHRAADRAESSEFPRLNERGSIEAITQKQAAGLVEARFHA